MCTDFYDMRVYCGDGENRLTNYRLQIDKLQIAD